MRKTCFGIVFLLLIVLPAGQNLWAGPADVVAVQVHRTSSQTYSFDVTVLHADTGWDHYADQWQVEAPDGQVLGTRVLYHPHVEEQPFTRSLSNVEIPSGIKQVTIRAHDKVHGWGGKTIAVNLTLD